MRPSRYDEAGYDGKKVKPNTMLLLPDSLYKHPRWPRELRDDVAAWMRENNIQWQEVEVPVALIYGQIKTETGIWFPKSPNNALLFKMRWS